MIKNVYLLTNENKRGKRGTFQKKFLPGDRGLWARESNACMYIHQIKLVSASFVSIATSLCKDIVYVAKYKGKKT